MAAKHTISALARNRPGVLADLALEFKKHGANIRSLSAGETEDPEVSRIVVGVEADDPEIAAITEALAHMPGIIGVDDLSRREFVDRELALIKVARTHESLTQIMQLLEVFRAGVVGMGETTLTVEISGDQERVEGLIRMLAPYGIRSMCRTGRIALKRGDD